MNAKPCPKCKAVVEFKPSMAIRNYSISSNEGTVNVSDTPAIDEHAMKCPQCGFTVGQDDHRFWNP